MANDQRISLTVQVNAETGQLEVLGSKMKQTGQAATDAFKSFLPAITAGTILAFFKSAVQGAEEENESLRRLKFTLEQSGQAWDLNKKSVIEWSQAVQNSTRFSDGEALQSLDKLARSTKTVTQAQSAATLAMNLSVSSGKPLAETTELINNLIVKQERAITLTRREFSNYVGAATDAQGILDALQKSVAGAAEKEESLTKTTAQSKNAFAEFSEQIGQTIMPAVNVLIGGLTNILKIIDNVGDAVAAQAAVIFHSFSALGSAIKAVASGNFSELKTIFNQFTSDVKTDLSNSIDHMVKEWEGGEQKKALSSIRGAEERLKTSEVVDAEALRKREEAVLKLEQLELDLDQKMASIGEQTLQKKLANLSAEIKMKQNAINAQIKLGVDGQKAQDKLNAYELAQRTALIKQESFLSQQRAFEIANLAVQTLQTVNSLGEKGSAAERARAKALLALQQSIAIGWAWVNAMKVGGPFATGLAAATTALLVAQFASQSKAIDQSASRESSDIASISVAPTAPGIDLGSVGGGLAGTGEGSISVSGGSGGSGGGGGGGATTIINLGGMTVNFDIDRISMDNIDEVMRRIYERVRQGVTEGIQLSVLMKNVADKNSSLAV